MFGGELQTVREDRETKNHKTGKSRQTTGKEG
jgi:hypothetical protein